MNFWPRVQCYNFTALFPMVELLGFGFSKSIDNAEKLRELPSSPSSCFLTDLVECSIELEVLQCTKWEGEEVIVLEGTGKFFLSCTTSLGSLFFCHLSRFTRKQSMLCSFGT